MDQQIDTKDKDLYRQVLGLKPPWSVSEVKVDRKTAKVKVHLSHQGGDALQCPKCGVAGGLYDHRQRTWRHLDTCEFGTVIVAQVPRARSGHRRGALGRTQIPVHCEL